jgi:pimeloyl-ACP methyl ester carboxylesterase
MPELHATSEDGTIITAIDEGSGPTVLVVHPSGQDERSWDAVAALLIDEYRYRVVRIRRRIYASPTATAAEAATATFPGHTYATEAADVLAVAALLDRPLLLVGHSAGAVAALEAALRAPGTFAAIVAYEPPMPTRQLVGGAATTWARAELDAGDPLEAIRIHLRDIVGLPAGTVDEILADPEGHTRLTEFAAAQVADVEALDALGTGIDRYRALTVPTVLLQGDLSPAHLLERTKDLAAVLPAARVVTLPGQGHIAHLMAPRLLAAQIREAADRVLI